MENLYASFICLFFPNRKERLNNFQYYCFDVCVQGRMETFQQLTSLHLILPFFTHTHLMYIICPWSFFFKPRGLVHSMLSAPPASSVHFVQIWLFSNVFDWARRQALKYEQATLFKSLQVITRINLQSDDGICLQKTLFPFCQRCIVRINHTVSSLIVLPLLRLIWSLDLCGNVVHAENVTAQTRANAWVE